MRLSWLQPGALSSNYTLANSRAQSRKIMHVYNLALSLAVASATITSSNAIDHASAEVAQLDMTVDAPVLDVLRTNAGRKLGKSGKSSKSNKSSKSSKSNNSSTKGSKGDNSSSKSKKSKKSKNKKAKKTNRANDTGNTAKREPIIINKADNSETDGGSVILNKAAATSSPTEAPSRTPTLPPSANPTENPTSSPTEADVAADYQPFEQADWSMIDPGLDSGKSKNPVGLDSYVFSTVAPTFKPTNTPTVPPSESPVASPKSDLNANTYQCFYEQGVKICFTYNDDATCEMSVENKECSCCLYTNINHPVISSFDCTNLGEEWGGMGPCLAADTRAAELHFPGEDDI